MPYKWISLLEKTCKVIIKWCTKKSKVKTQDCVHPWWWCCVQGFNPLCSNFEAWKAKWIIWITHTKCVTWMEEKVRECHGEEMIWWITFEQTWDVVWQPTCPRIKGQVKEYLLLQESAGVMDPTDTSMKLGDLACHQQPIHRNQSITWMKF